MNLIVPLKAALKWFCVIVVATLLTLWSSPLHFCASFTYMFDTLRKCWQAFYFVYIWMQKGKINPVHIVDVPGHPRLKPKLEELLPQACGIVFVVDAMDFMPQLRGAAEYDSSLPICCCPFQVTISNGSVYCWNYYWTWLVSVQLLSCVWMLLFESALLQVRE